MNKDLGSECEHHNYLMSYTVDVSYCNLDALRLGTLQSQME